MNKDIRYSVAGFVFRVTLPGDIDVCSMLPSFAGFEFQGEECGEELFHLSLVDTFPSAIDGLEQLETSDDDMGVVRLFRNSEGYCFNLTCDMASSGRMYADRYFRKAIAMIDFTDSKAGHVLTSFLRILYSQAILFKNAVSMHASVIVYKDEAVMFMGKSGTGKSTHSRLWLDNVPGCFLLNDDNPTVRLDGDAPVVCGTPWSGKTPCYRNESYPLRGIARLRQAEHNVCVPRSEVSAFVELLPGCSVIRYDKTLYDRLCSTLVSLAEKTMVARLECLPDNNAVSVCMNYFYGNN